jgi:hypothetical protein
MVNGDGLTGAGRVFDAAVEKSRLSIPQVSKELICKDLMV